MQGLRLNNANNLTCADLGGAALCISDQHQIKDLGCLLIAPSKPPRQVLFSLSC